MKRNLFLLTLFISLCLPLCVNAGSVVPYPTDEIISSSAVTVRDIDIYKGAEGMGTGTSSKGDFDFDSKTGTVTKYTGLSEIVDIPDNIDGFSVKCIGRYAFGENAFIKEINIPQSVEFIGDGAMGTGMNETFGYLSGLKSINVASGNTAYHSVDGVLFDSENVLLLYPAAKDGEIYFIPENTKYIYASAMYNASALKDIFFADSSVGSFRSFPDGATLHCLKNTAVEEAAKLYGYKTVTNSIGDADGNGVVNANDSAVIMQKVLDPSFVMPIEEITDNYLLYTDVDGSGSLTAADAAMLLQKTLKGDFGFALEKR